jgi:chemosensory pili system protein ChpA (sensor histidine kinase/response regulator)
MNARPQLITGIHWVRGELDQSITRARTLIDHYAESGGDPLQLQQAYIELHQVRGTAAMIECHGLATVAAEMAAALQDLSQQRIAEPEPLYGALLGATVQLGDYINALADGMPDCVLVMQPAINELRLARGQPVLTESELFVAQMQALGSRPAAADDQAGLAGAAQQQAQRLLALFQASLVAWVRGGADAQTGAARTGKIAELIAQHAVHPALHQLWRIAAATIEAFLGRGVGNALELKRLFGRLAAQLKLLAETGEDAAAAQVGDLSLQLLFLVGRATTQGARAQALRQLFDLDAYLPHAPVLEQMRHRIHGANTALLTTVAKEIRSEFAKVKDQIDLMVRTGERGERATAVASGLERIGQTLGALGIVRLRQVLTQQAHELRRDAAGQEGLMELATAILRIENDLEDALFRQMQRPEQAAQELSTETPAQRDLAEGRGALYREFLVNLARVKTAVDTLVRSGQDVDLGACVPLVNEIASGFEVLAQPHAAELSRRLAQLLHGPAAARLRDPAQADRFADALAALEYYVEGQRAGLPGVERILGDMGRALSSLEAQLAPSAAPAAELADELAEATPTEAVSIVPEAAAAPEQEAAGDDPEIREIFLEEAGEVLESLRKAFAAWNRDPQDRESLTTLRRAFHTLKGSGRTVGAARIGEFGWALENMLNKCLDGSVGVSPGIVETVGRAVGALPQLIEDFRERRVDAADEQIEQIQDFARDYAAGRTPPGMGEPDIAQVFREDVGDKLAGVEAWLAAQSVGSAAVDAQVVRAYHTLRGAARIVEAPAISELAGGLEDYLDALREARLAVSADALDLMREATTVLRGWVDEVGTTAVQRQDAAPWLARIDTLRAGIPAVAVQASNERQLAEIFAGEAFELVSALEEQLRGWAQAPDNRRAAGELKLLSHTLLGAAQMSSCPAIAGVARALNRSFLAADAAALVPEPGAVATLLAVCEGLYQYLDRYRENRLDGDDDRLAARVDALGWSVAPEPAATPPAQAPGQQATDPGSSGISAIGEAAAATGIPDLSLESFDLGGFDESAEPAPMAADEPLNIDLANKELSWATDVEPERRGGKVAKQPPAPAPTIEDLPIDAAPPADDTEDIGEMPPVEGGGAASDAELLSIFEAEAEELLEGLDQSVAALERDPRQFMPLAEIKRLLHTFKGGARVSGLDTLGEIGHRLESVFEDVESGRLAPDAQFFARVHNVLDGLHLALDDLKRGVIPAPVALLDELALDAPAAPAVTAPPPAEPAAPPPGWSPPPTPVWTPPVAAAPAPAPTAGLPADFDVDLAQTFAAEAEELMEILEEALPRWQALPGDFTPARDMLRALHTYKGGARMAGLAAMGDAAHELESLIEGLEYAGELDAGALRVVEGAVLELRRFTDRLQRGDYAALLRSDGDDSEEAAPLKEPVPQSLAEPTLDAPPGVIAEPPAGEPAPQSGAETAPLPQGMWDPQLFWRPDEASEGLAASRRETARVAVDVLDKMLNEAGEISIYRSRMDEHNAAIQTQLDDMAQAIQRVRDQLRQLDMETDAQITARGLSAAESADRYAGEFDPLEMDRYTRMQELSRALNESVGDLSAVHASIDQLASEATTILLQQGRINTEVQQGLMRTLMVPFSRQVARLQRVVQQAASENGKRVEIAFDGVDAELDRNVLERMTAPLEHLLRNAVIHGIEAPDARAAAGKSVQGRLKLTLWREGSQLYIELADDGRGLDLDAIRQTAIRRGLMPADAEVSDDEAAQFIFVPGFSTARALTQDAGRGVGMDVVAAEVKQLGGNLELASEVGKGARFTVRLPLSLAISQSLLVGVGHELYATPLTSVEGITRITREQLVAYLAEDGPQLEYGGNSYRVRHLADLIGLPRDLGAADARTAHAILVRMPEGIGGTERHVAVIVDHLVGSRQVVSKAVGPQVSTIPGVSGATILADGRVVLILDVAALVQDRTRRALRTQVAVVTGREAPAEAQRDTIMVVDDSITIRRVTERLLAKHGFAVVMAKDGLDAMAQLATERPAAILLDIEMPRADGFEVATYVRNTEAIARTPILMITSRSGDKHRERAAAIGVDRYLIKPYQEDQLLAELHAVLQERRA